MGQIKIKKTKVPNRKINNQIVLISDIHYNDKSDQVKLNNVLKAINTLNPDYIWILGDICDQAKILDEDILITWLTQLAKITTVIVVYGNHDIALYDNGTCYINDKLFNKIKKIKNLYLLDNQLLTINNICFVGLKLDYKYYYDTKEDPEEFIKHYNRIVNSLDPNTYNIILSHSPIALTKKGTLLKLNDYSNIDLILCGHMHGGMIPNLLRPIFKTTGLIGPSKRGLFIKNAYGCFKVNDISFVVSSGITKLSKVSKINFLDNFFGPEVFLIEVQTDDFDKYNKK